MSTLPRPAERNCRFDRKDTPSQYFGPSPRRRDRCAHTSSFPRLSAPPACRRTRAVHFHVTCARPPGSSTAQPMTNRSHQNVTVAFTTRSASARRIPRPTNRSTRSFRTIRGNGAPRFSPAHALACSRSRYCRNVRLGPKAGRQVPASLWRPGTARRLPNPMPTLSPVPLCASAVSQIRNSNLTAVSAAVAVRPRHPSICMARSALVMVFWGIFAG